MGRPGRELSDVYEGCQAALRNMQDFEMDRMQRIVCRRSNRCVRSLCVGPVRPASRICTSKVARLMIVMRVVISDHMERQL